MEELQFDFREFEFTDIILDQWEWHKHSLFKYALTRMLVRCSVPSLLRNSEKKHRKNILAGAETVRHSSTYIILNFSTI